MRKLSRILGLVALSCSVQWAVATPLFPDVPDGQWASDAVRSLAAKGLIEGYPDGTFKGDRATSRWETAMLLARLLRQADRRHPTFASETDLAELRKLALALQDELSALGVRLDELEQQLNFVDRRVTELERISFYGSIDARAVWQSFQNDGSGDNDSLRNGTGLPGNVPYLNYHNAVGSSLGATRRPQLQGILPVVDYRNGRALTNGTGLSTRATLGLNVTVSPTLDAGAEFSAYSSQGDQAVDAYWGVSAPWLSNPFTANAGGDQGAQSLSHTPYTRMNLDRLWVLHKTTKTRLTVGEILKTRMDPLVYAGQVNLGVYGPPRWAGWGVDVTGEFSLSGSDRLDWEIFRTQFGSGNVYLGSNYQNYVIGGNAAYHFHNKAGTIQINLLRIAEEAASGGALYIGGFGPGGGTNGINVAPGASSGWTVRQWVNPPGYLAGQQTAFEQANSGRLVGGVFQPNLVDKRPIAGWNGGSDDTVGFTSGGGNFGPQSENVYGLTGIYQWTLGETENSPTLNLEGRWARSDYRPNRNSGYTASGNASHVSLDSQLLDRTLDLGVEYLAVDARYSPAAWFGNVLGVRFPRSMNFTGVWHPNDFARYPHNREGVRLRGEWSFNEAAGKVWGKARFLNQRETSLYDVRVTSNSLGNGLPTSNVLGYSPGFIDPIFSGYASPLIYGSVSGNSFTANLIPLEDSRGSETGFDVGFRYQWDAPNLTLNANYGQTSLYRPTSLSPAFGGDQNLVDLTIDTAHLSLAWETTAKLTLTGGADYTRSRGHFDPSGLYHSYALRTNQTDFTNIDSGQIAPFLGADYKLSEQMTWGTTARRYTTTDHVTPSVQAGTAFDSFGSSAHPFDWSGIQIESHFNINF